MKKIAVILGFLVFASSAFAQAARPDPAAEAAVRKLLTAMDYRASMARTMAQMSANMPAMMRNSVAGRVAADPRLTDDQRKQAIADAERTMPRALEAVNKVMNDPALLDEMTAEMVPLYARTFTVGELDQLTAFYSSPVGKKTIASMPQIMAAGMEAGNRIVTPRLNKLMAEMMKPAAK
ncbi:MAG: DUF2059 domain-containing protein [Pseudomonadota bacterium]